VQSVLTPNDDAAEKASIRRKRYSPSTSTNTIQTTTAALCSAGVHSNVYSNSELIACSTMRGTLRGSEWKHMMGRTYIKMQLSLFPSLQALGRSASVSFRCVCQPGRSSQAPSTAAAGPVQQQADAVRGGQECTPGADAEAGNRWGPLKASILDMHTPCQPQLVPAAFPKLATEPSTKPLPLTLTHSPNVSRESQRTRSRTAMRGIST
jgi:hypothetical protein